MAVSAWSCPGKAFPTLPCCYAPEKWDAGGTHPSHLVVPRESHRELREDPGDPRRGRPIPLLGAVVPLWFSDWFLTLGLMRSRNSPIISQGSVRSSDRACRDPGVGDGIRRCSWEGSATLPLTHVIYGLSPPSHTPIPSCSIQSRSHPAGLIPPIPGTSQSRDTSIPAEAAEGRKEEQQLQGCARPGFLVGTRQGCPGASPAQETFPRWNLAPELPIHFNYKKQHPECQTQLFAAERWN